MPAAIFDDAHRLHRSAAFERNIPVRHVRRGHGLYRIDDKVHDNLLQLGAMTITFRSGARSSNSTHSSTETRIQQSRAFRMISERGLGRLGVPLLAMVRTRSMIGRVAHR